MVVTCRNEEHGLACPHAYLDIWRCNIWVLLICSCYEYIPKYRPPLKEKATRSIDSYKKDKLKTMPSQKWNQAKKTPLWLFKRRTNWIWWDLAFCLEGLCGCLKVSLNKIVIYVHIQPVSSLSNKIIDHSVLLRRVKANMRLIYITTSPSQTGWKQKTFRTVQHCIVLLSTRSHYLQGVKKSRLKEYEELPTSFIVMAVHCKTSSCQYICTPLLSYKPAHAISATPTVATGQ